MLLLPNCIPISVSHHDRRVEIQKLTLGEGRGKRREEEQKRDARSISVYVAPDSRSFIGKSRVLKKASSKHHKHNASFDEPIGPRLVHRTMGLPHA